MLGVYSLWTETTEFKLNRAQAMLFSSALAFGCRSFDSVELVTDLYGVEVADRLGWDTSSIVSALTDFCSPQSKHIWMLGKIRSQLIHSHHPHVHVDLDLHLYQSLNPNLREHKVFVQSKDCLEPYQHPSVLNAMDLCSIPRHTVPYNVGIIGWNDSSFCEDYCRKSLKLADSVSSLIPHGGVASIVCEQMLLSHMARERGFRVHTLVPIPTSVIEEDLIENPFTHYWGKSKKNPLWLDLAEKRFKEEFPEAYKRFDLGWKNLKPHKGVDLG